MIISGWSSYVCSAELKLHPVSNAMAHTRTRNLDVQRVLGWAGIGIGGEVEVENGEFVGQRYPLKSVPFDANTIGPILIEPAQIKATGMIGGTLAPEHVRLDQHSVKPRPRGDARSEEHTSELQPTLRISYAVFCLNTQT